VVELKASAWEGSGSTLNKKADKVWVSDCGTKRKSGSGGGNNKGSLKENSLPKQHRGSPNLRGIEISGGARTEGGLSKAKSTSKRAKEKRSLGPGGIKKAAAFRRKRLTKKKKEEENPGILSGKRKTT